MGKKSNPPRGYKELLTKNDGHKIHHETAENWKNIFEFRESGIRANFRTVNYYFSKSVIENLLKKNNIIGIRVYYALSTDGIKELIVYAVDKSGDDLSANPVVRDSSNKSINPETAVEWRNLYESVDGEHRHGGILTKGHFFGKKCIFDLFKHPGANGMKIFHALTDKGENELLIYASKDEKNVCNKYYVLDMSRRCPPYC